MLGEKCTYSEWMKKGRKCCYNNGIIVVFSDNFCGPPHFNIFSPWEIFHHEILSWALPKKEGQIKTFIYALRLAQWCFFSDLTFATFHSYQIFVFQSSVHAQSHLYYWQFRNVVSRQIFSHWKVSLQTYCSISYPSLPMN